MLKQVFAFLPGNWLFLGAVCREWQTVSINMADQQVHSFQFEGGTNLVTCDARTTLYSAAVATPAIARLAQKAGMQTCGPLCNSLLVTAGLHADRPTLAALRGLGMPFSSTLVCAAALSGRLNILQHLIKIKRCSIPERFGCYAARSGSISMLKWLRVREGCFFDRRTCAAAAEAGHLAALQPLRSEAYRWDSEQ
jgi:hypothetical protein